MDGLPANTILIVDDNVGARRSIEALLAPENYRLLLTASGAEALEIAAREHPDLILLDVMMPGMNGFEVCEALRASERLSEIPIIMITALDDDESMIRGIDVGADDFLSKPINKIELRSRVRGILRLNRYRKLCDERQKFEIVVTHSMFGYIVLDVDRRIRFANPKACEILMMESEQCAGLDFMRQAKLHYAVKPSDSELRLSAGRPANAAEPFLLVRPRTASSEPRWIRASRMDLGGSVRDQMLVRLEDITHNVLSFQEKHTFSRMISHKLLTPLHAMKAADQLISEKRSASKAYPEIEHIFDLQRKGLSRLEYDIHSILKFLESTSRPALDAPKSRIGDLCLHLNDIARDAGIGFEMEPPPEPVRQLQIGISPYNFEACARELFENAIKFRSCGYPAIKCLAAVASDESSASFQFLSNATPLTDEEKSNAWKPYWQADRYFTGEIPGMGLGLALIATNVWSAGGTCKIANRSDEPGVSVTLAFPTVCGEPNQPSARAAGAEAKG